MSKFTVNSNFLDLFPEASSDQIDVYFEFWVHINLFPEDFHSARRNAILNSEENKKYVFNFDFQEKKKLKGYRVEIHENPCTLYKDDENLCEFFVRDSRKKNCLVSIALRYYPLEMCDLFYNGLTDRIFRYIQETFKPEVECFATPYDHQLEKYCGFFEEDKEFGSLGNFFEVDLGGKVCIANVPQVDKVIDELWDQLEKNLRTNGSLFFVVIKDLPMTSINKMIAKSDFMAVLDDFILLVFSNENKIWDSTDPGILQSLIDY